MVITSLVVICVIKYFRKKCLREKENVIQTPLLTRKKQEIEQEQTGIGDEKSQQDKSIKN